MVPTRGEQKGRNSRGVGSRYLHVRPAVPGFWDFAATDEVADFCGRDELEACRRQKMPSWTLSLSTQLFLEPTADLVGLLSLYGCHTSAKDQ